jgi:hypothetical protein
MNTVLPITTGFYDDAKGYMGQQYFYGPVTLTNTGTTDLIGLSLVVDRFEGSDKPLDWQDYFEIYYMPANFSIKAGETKFVTVVYIPKQVSMTSYDNTQWWYFYAHVEDAQGNASPAGDPVHTVFVMPEANTDVTQVFDKKWQPDTSKDEYIYSYSLTLTSEEGASARVKDWYLFFNLPEGAYVSPDWLKTQEDWLQLSGEETPVSNSIIVTKGDGSHTIDPGTSIQLDIEIFYPRESTEYETLKNLAFNYKFEDSLLTVRP